MESTLSPPRKRGFIDRNGLKYIVIAAMVLDHIALGFYGYLPTAVSDLFHFVGRLTGPTMAFFLTEGYIHTRDAVKYQKRLGIFAAVSWLPFVFFEYGVGGIIKDPSLMMIQSVIFTLFLGITALRVWDSKEMKKDERIVIIILLCFLSLIGDWPVMDVLAPLFLYIYRDNRVKRYLLISAVYFINIVMAFTVGWYNLGVLLVPLTIIFCYNGEGGKKNAFNKWFFYAFYPAHLLVLGILRWYVF